MKRMVLFALAFAIFTFILNSTEVFASAQRLPWEGPLIKLKNSLSGPVALSISVIAIVVTGATLVFGGELGEFARRMIMLVMVISLLVMSQNVLSGFFSTSGAIISSTYENPPPPFLYQVTTVSRC